MRRLDEIFRGMGEVATSKDDTASWYVVEDGAEPPPAEPAEPAADPSCPTCRGVGFVRRRVAIGHPEFGKAVPCACVEQEQAVERTARLERYSNLGLLRRMTFATVLPDGRSPEPEHQRRFRLALEAAKGYAEAPEGWLALLGRSGSGKTHLAAAVANRCIERGQPVLFIVVPDLLDHLRAAYRPDAEEPYDRLFEQVRGAPLLILDDLGAQAATAWAAEKLYQIINHRYNAQLPTVVTSSTPLDQLDERLRTRLTDPTFTQICQLEEGGATARSAVPDLLSLPLMRQMTFQTFNPVPLSHDPRDANNLTRALDTCRQHAGHPDGWLVLLGDTGVGKTHLAAAIAHDWRDAGRQVAFVVVPDLLDRIRAGVREDDGDQYTLLEQIRTSDHLVLDDLGVHSATPWAQEKLFQILNYRYNGRLPTVITIGRPLEELPDALVSRMHDPKVSDLFRIEAPDYRGLRRPDRRDPPRAGRRR
jgi:DNA replication protein DnaC